jgi:DNA-binding transcriptional ArsR family regulator
MANYLAGAAQAPSDLDPVFMALGDPTRRSIVQRLVLGRATVSELAAPFSMALPSLLKHLGVLERSGLIRTEKRGRVRSCVLQADRLQLAEGWLAEQRQLWEARSDRMAAHVAQMMAAEAASSMVPKERSNESQR